MKNIHLALAAAALLSIFGNLSVAHAAPPKTLHGKAADATQGELLLAPIPFKVLFSLSDFRGISVSPDESVAIVEVVNNGNHRPQYSQPGSGVGFSATGVPLFADGNEMWILDLKTQAVRKFTPPSTADWAPAWSSDGRLAFYSDRDGAVRLWLWNPSTNKVRRVSSAIVRPTMDGGSDKPQWIEGNKKIFTKLLPEGMTLQDSFDMLVRKSPVVLTREDAVTAEVLSTKSTSSVPNGMNKLLTDMGLIDVDTGETSRVVNHVYAGNARVSPNGAWLAYDTWVYPADGSQGRGTLEVVATGSREVVLSKPDMPWLGDYSWAPDSALLVYRTKPTVAGKIMGYSALNLADLHSVPLAKGLPDDTQIGEVVWNSAGHGMYLKGWPSGGGVWRLDELNARPMRVEFPQGIRVSSGADGGIYHPDGRDSYLIISHDETARKDSISIFDTRRNGMRTVLSSDTGEGFGKVVPLNSGGYVYTRRGYRGGVDVWIYDAGSKHSKRVMSLNSDYEKYAKATVREVTWLVHGGVMSGKLILPADYRQGRRYPLLVNVYSNNRPLRTATAGEKVGLQGPSSEADPQDQLFASRGFAVLKFTAAHRLATPAKDIAEQTMAGVDELIRLGIVDGDRLAVRGVSFGGYCVRVLITESNRFKAAISVVGMGGNLLSTYTAMNDDGSPRWASWMEQGLGVGLMKVSPWKDRQRYLDNSPFFSYDKVNTPILIEVGMNDTVGYESYETFVAFKMLGLDAEMVRYYGERHSGGELWGFRNNVDFANRQLKFLAKHLDMTLDEHGAIIFDGARARAAAKGVGEKD